MSLFWLQGYDKNHAELREWSFGSHRSRLQTSHQSNMAVFLHNKQDVLCTLLPELWCPAGGVRPASDTAPHQVNGVRDLILGDDALLYHSGGFHHLVLECIFCV